MEATEAELRDARERAPSAEPPVGLLMRVASAIDTTFIARPVERVATVLAANEGVDEPWSLTVAARCRAAGLRTRTVEAHPRELATLLGRRAAVAWFDPVSGWAAVVRDRADRLKVIRPHEPDRRVSPLDLELEAGLASNEPATLVVVEPTLEAAVDRSGGMTPARRLAALLSADRADLVTVLIYAVFVGLLTLATPIAVQQLVNSVALGGLVQPVVVLAFLLLLGLAFAGLLTVLQTVAVELIQRRIFVRACADLAHRLPRVAPDAFGDRHAPEVVNRFFDLAQIQKSGATLLMGGTSLILQTVAGLTILSFYHPLMLGFSVLLILSIAFVVGVLGRGATRSAIAESSAKYELGAWMEQIVLTPEVFRSRAGRAHAGRTADALAAAWIDARKRHFRIVLRQVGASVGLQVGASTAVLALGGFLVVAGQLTLGQLVASELIVAAVVAAFARLGKLLESAYDLLAAVDKVGVLLDLPLEEIEGDGNEPADAGRASDATEAGRASERPRAMHLERRKRVPHPFFAGEGEDST